MARRTKETLRGAATALAVSTGVLALACTAQTPDGYIHASFGGPLDVFGSDSSDFLSIGDGANDATELANLLKGPIGPAARTGAANSPYRVAYEAGVAPSTTTGEAAPMPAFDTASPTPEGANETAILPATPLVDAQGRIDCTGAVTCRTDPATNITTVTYPSGATAVVQKINDLTVVAYKATGEPHSGKITTNLRPDPTDPPVPAAAAPPPPITSSKMPTDQAPVPSDSTLTILLDPGPPDPGPPTDGPLDGTDADLRAPSSNNAGQASDNVGNSSASSDDSSAQNGSGTATQQGGTSTQQGSGPSQPGYPTGPRVDTKHATSQPSSTGGEPGGISTPEDSEASVDDSLASVDGAPSTVIPPNFEVSGPSNGPKQSSNSGQSTTGSSSKGGKPSENSDQGTSGGSKPGSSKPGGPKSGS